MGIETTRVNDIEAVGTTRKAKESQSDRNGVVSGASSCVCYAHCPQHSRFERSCAGCSAMSLRLCTFENGVVSP